MRRSLVCLLLLLAPLTALADAIELVNGDKLSGDLVEQSAERVVLKGLLGPSLTKRWSESDFFVEALVGLDALWKISKDHSLRLTNTIYPALNDLGEFRNLSTLAWKWKLMEDPGLSLIAGVDNEYESNVESELEHNDVKYSTSIGIDF